MLAMPVVRGSGHASPERQDSGWVCSAAGHPGAAWGMWGFATCSPRLGSNVQALSRAGNELRVRAGVLQ